MHYKIGIIPDDQPNADATVIDVEEKELDLMNVRSWIATADICNKYIPDGWHLVKVEQVEKNA